MAGTVRAIAVDLDGTIAQHNRVSEAALGALSEARGDGAATVSYTHLDVYKRQQPSPHFHANGAAKRRRGRRNHNPCAISAHGHQ